MTGTTASGVGTMRTTLEGVADGDTGIDEFTLFKVGSTAEGTAVLSSPPELVVEEDEGASLAGEDGTGRDSLSESCAFGSADGVVVDKGEELDDMVDVVPIEIEADASVVEVSVITRRDAVGEAISAAVSVLLLASSASLELTLAGEGVVADDGELLKIGDAASLADEACAASAEVDNEAWALIPPPSTV